MVKTVSDRRSPRRKDLQGQKARDVCMMMGQGGAAGWADSPSGDMGMTDRALLGVSRLPRQVGKGIDEQAWNANIKVYPVFTYLGPL